MSYISVRSSWAAMPAKLEELNRLRSQGLYATPRPKAIVSLYGMAGSLLTPFYLEVKTVRRRDNLCLPFADGLLTF